MSDGELEEGQSWEAIMFAAKYRLDNITAVIDRNFIQIDGNTEDVMPLEPLKQKLEAFNWNVLVVNGHDYPKLLDAFKSAAQFKGKPTVIIALTTPARELVLWKTSSSGTARPQTRKKPRRLWKNWRLREKDFGGEPPRMPGLDAAMKLNPKLLSDAVERVAARARVW